jgi:hypothetical protein
MRTISTAIPLLLACGCLLAPIAALPAADGLQDFHRAIAGDDLDAKRAALRALVDSELPDALILPPLVEAVGDRQASDDAIAALRARTGLTPAVYFGQSHYPGYPCNDHADSWQVWLHDWQADDGRQLEIDQVLAASRRALAEAQRAEEAAAAARRAHAAAQPPSGQP